MKVIVGSRGSNLAITQTNWVLSSLREKCPELEFEIKIIKTKGDKILDKALDKIGDKGLFVTEIENELINGDIDLAFFVEHNYTSKNLSFFELSRHNMYLVGDTLENIKSKKQGP